MLRRNSTQHSSNKHCAAGSGTLSPTATALMSMLLRAIGDRPCTCQQQGSNHSYAGWLWPGTSFCVCQQKRQDSQSSSLAVARDSAQHIQTEKPTQSIR